MSRDKTHTEQFSSLHVKNVDKVDSPLTSNTQLKWQEVDVLICFNFCHHGCSIHGESELTFDLRVTLKILQ